MPVCSHGCLLQIADRRTDFFVVLFRTRVQGNGEVDRYGFLRRHLPLRVNGVEFLLLLEDGLRDLVDEIVGQIALDADCRSDRQGGNGLVDPLGPARGNLPDQIVGFLLVAFFFS